MSRLRFSFAFLMIAVCLVGVLERRAHSQAVDPGPFYVAGELLIKFRPDASDAAKAAARALVGAGRKARLRANGSGELELAGLPGRADLADAIRRLRQNAAVIYAEPNWIYTHQDVPDDPYYTNGSLWGMYGDTTSPANAFGSQAAEAWAAGHTGSPNVYIGVIDEGIDLNHPDLAANIWNNPHDWADGVDNDGNGYVDDLHGWDFFQNNNSIYDGAPGNNTTDRHGTHVAGTIGAIGGNAAGVVGVNWNVRLISGKFLGPSGGSTANAIRAVDYFTDLKTRHGLNIVATSNSWGGGGYSQALHEAIIRAANADILFVAAAGNLNRNNDSSVSYPANYNTAVGTPNLTAASYDSVISVASITSAGARSSFSNYGRTTVDLGAPGSAIISTTPNGTYSSLSGTSMATPHVSGAAALYAAMNPGLTAAAIKTAILNGTTFTSSLNGITVTNGRLDIGNLVGPPTPPSPPDAPSGLTATPVSSTQINLAWTDNSSNEDGFYIERCTGAGCVDFAHIGSTPAGAMSFANTGLSASTTYRYRVRAFNTAGTSNYSLEAEATTPEASAPLAAPSNLTATPGASAGRINLSWQDNSSAEQAFMIERCAGVSCTNFALANVVGAGVTSFTDSGLTPGTWYRYRVRAHRPRELSAPSNVASAQAP
jgi:subtilisin family serine protease